MLLPAQPPLCPPGDRALRDVPPRPRAAQTTSAAALGVPPGAPRASGVGVSLGAGAGGAARLRAPSGEGAPRRRGRFLRCPSGLRLTPRHRSAAPWWVYWATPAKLSAETRCGDGSEG